MEPCCPLEGQVPEAQAGGDAGPGARGSPWASCKAPLSPPLCPSSASHSRTTFRLTSIRLLRQYDVGGAPSSSSRSRAPKDSARSAQNTGPQDTGQASLKILKPPTLKKIGFLSQPPT